VISSVRVTVNITHTYDSDLTLTLIAPDGRRITLANRRGLSGDNYTNTIFDDTAGTAISGGVATFTGSVRPEQLLSQLAGLDPNGDWKLEAVDNVAIDSGKLVGWSLSITTGVSGARTGNKMDQNMNGAVGESPTGFNTAGDYYAVPTPTGLAPFNGTEF